METQERSLSLWCLSFKCFGQVRKLLVSEMESAAGVGKTNAYNPMRVHFCIWRIQDLTVDVLSYGTWTENI
ncbi:hypothetical protein ACQ4M3_24935 [Leptolyngbya sp. AN03gr2]|uniref:hypothetical protein n=1 Tax=Leptolyngbya sp. AN03gr2 TaxID=3423364 RepID=UPI003D31DB93